jgi:hypothetical protein
MKSEVAATIARRSLPPLPWHTSFASTDSSPGPKIAPDPGESRNTAPSPRVKKRNRFQLSGRLRERFLETTTQDKMLLPLLTPRLFMTTAENPTGILIETILNAILEVFLLCVSPFPLLSPGPSIDPNCHRIRKQAVGYVLAKKGIINDQAKKVRLNLVTR